MLATDKDVHHAMNLSPRNIVDALESTGYTGSVISAARFVGFNGTSFVYEIEFPDDTVFAEEGEDDPVICGKVYVKMVEDPVNKKLVFQAEY